MNDSIKVWVALTPGQSLLLSSTGDSDLVAMENAENAFETTWGVLKNKGWTIQPYTLTHGHKE